MAGFHEFLSDFSVSAPVSFILRGMLETHDENSMENDLTDTGIMKIDADEMNRDSDRILWDGHGI